MPVSTRRKRRWHKVNPLSPKVRRLPQSEDWFFHDEIYIESASESGQFVISDFGPEQPRFQQFTSPANAWTGTLFRRSKVRDSARNRRLPPASHGLVRYGSNTP